MDEKLVAVMRKWKASEEQVAKVLKERSTVQAKPPEEVEIWPENWDTWLFFLKVQTQWTYAATGLAGSVRVSLNWEGVRAIALMRGVSDQDQQRFADGLGEIERAVLEVERDKAARSAASANNKGRRR